MFAANSLLFVPGSRPERFAKARAAGAGLTVIDLEDAVALGDKDLARAAALGEAPASDLSVRINALGTVAGVADLHALASAPALPATLLLPMVEDARDVELVAQILGERCPQLIPLIETPRGLRNALPIARAPSVSAVMFGGGDFSAELGVALAWEPLLTARQQLLLACAEAKVPAIDVPFVKLDDAKGLEEECARSRAIGFEAKAAIHPNQIAAIEAAFAPSREQVNEAADALRAYEEGGEQAIRHNGRMLEAPLVKHYRAVLARAKDTANA
jgi:(S)-citramalyl-CoA lyase